MADLVMLAPPDGRGEPSMRETIFEAVPFNTRVPVLVGAGEQSVKRVTIAWDGIAGGLAATRAALPILREAGRVDIVTVDAGAETDGSDVAALLDRHGIRTGFAALSRAGRRVSEIIARQARGQGSGLIVMGAYGRSRLVETALGGVTRDLTRAVPLPLLPAR